MASRNSSLPGQRYDRHLRVDLLPTLCELTGTAVPTEIKATFARPERRGGVARRPIFSAYTTVAVRVALRDFWPLVESESDARDPRWPVEASAQSRPQPIGTLRHSGRPVRAGQCERPTP